MKHLIIPSALCGVLLALSPARAEDLVHAPGQTISKLYENCTSTNPDALLFCNAYIIGVVDADLYSLVMEHTAPLYCLPLRFGLVQLPHVIVGWLAGDGTLDREGATEIPASFAVRRALIQTFPCEESPLDVPLDEESPLDVPN